MFAMTSAFSWQNSISLCPTSFCYSKPNLPVTPGISWLPTFAFQSPIMKRILYEKGCASLYYRVSISSPNREGQWPRPSQPDPHRFYWQYIEGLSQLIVWGFGAALFREMSERWGVRQNPDNFVKHLDPVIPASHVPLQFQVHEPIIALYHD